MMAKMDYKKLLEKARKELPESVFVKERFEIPKVRGHIQGNKTLLSNFFQIADTLRRTPDHLLKYLSKELATQITKKGNMIVMGSKISASMINEKISKYAKEFVLCFDCGKPDTKIIVENDITYLKCLACGSKYPIKNIK